MTIFVNSFYCGRNEAIHLFSDRGENVIRAFWPLDQSLILSTSILLETGLRSLTKRQHSQVNLFITNKLDFKGNCPGSGSENLAFGLCVIRISLGSYLK